jgi:hypothetical protein
MKNITEMTTKAVTSVPNTRNTTSVTKEKIAVPRTEIRRLRLWMQIQLKEFGLFRITLFLTFILKQSGQWVFVPLKELIHMFLWNSNSSKEKTFNTVF